MVDTLTGRGRLYVLDSLKRALLATTLAASCLLSVAPSATHASTVPEFDISLPTQVAVGSSVNMTVALNTNTVQVTGWQFGFDYDPTLLQISTTNSLTPPTVGTFSTYFSDQAALLGASSTNINFKLTQDGATTSPGHVQAGGEALIGENQGTGVVGTSSSVVVTFTFTGLANGVAPITFKSFKVTDVNAVSIPGVTINPPLPAVTVGVPPKARADAAWGSDPGTGRMVLFGGFTTGNTPLADTWNWNGAWTRRNPASPPTARDGAQFVTDTPLNALLMYGSRQGSTETWTFHNGVWTLLTPAHNPGTRDDMGLAFDSHASRVVLFGGGPTAAQQNDTWLFDGTDWTQALPATSPPGRSQPGMAFDAATAQTVLFGGAATGTVSLGDTWTWNGTTWRQRTTPPTLSARTSPAMAYDPLHKQLVLFGGVNAQTGTTLTDTWLWNGTAWTQAAPTFSPPSSSAVRARMAYDPALQKVVLFGGCCFSNQVWLWDGTNWANQ
jgi:hypothetical protein